MARGGARPGAGRPKGVKTLKENRKSIPADIRSAARAAKVSPLDYMLAVMNDEDADPARRDRMAQAAAPFVHPKAEPVKPSAKAQVEETARNADRGTTWSALLQ